MTTVRPAKPGDLKYIEHLRWLERNAVGFLPKAAYMEILAGKRPAKRLLVCVDNEELTGYCYCSFGRDPAKIQQLVIQNDARRWQRGMLILFHVEMIAAKLGFGSMRARVAADLEANLFWRYAGFRAVDVDVSTHYNRRPSNSQRQIVVYLKAVRRFKSRALESGRSNPDEP